MRPKSVTVLGVVGIILAGMGIVGGVLTIASSIFHLDLTPPMPKSFDYDTLYIWTSWVSVLAGVVIAVLQLVVSIGSLGLRQWARKGMIVYAWLALVQLCYGTMFNLLYVFPKIIASTPAATQPDAGGLMTGGYVLGGGILFLGSIFPVCVLYFFSRGRVVDAFKGIYLMGLGGAEEVVGEESGSSSLFY